MKAIEEKKSLIKQFKDKKDEYVETDIEYKSLKAKLLLETDFNEVLNKSRPTVDDKKAYVDLMSIDLKKKKDLLYNEIKVLELEIDLYNDIIQLESR